LTAVRNPVDDQGAERGCGLKLSVVDQSPIPAGATSSDALRNSIELAVLADRLGYERFWIAEHHGTGGFASPAPEVLISRIAGETKSIRVGSGGVLLPHYAPLKVAEVFLMLHAMYPGRIDLGVGRAPGGTPLETYALQPEHSEGRHQRDDFPAKLSELLAFLRRAFPADHPYARIPVLYGTEGWPDVWLLGSSGWSAEAAVEFELPYAFAHFINPESTRRSLELFRAHAPEGSRALVSLGVICADTEAEAERLYLSHRLLRVLRREGYRGPIPTPEEAAARLGDGRDDPMAVTSEWPRYVVGNPEQVAERLTRMAEALRVDELMAITVVHHHAARLRSYELLAQAFGLEPRGR
jgi:luciferase family oxidoreductase group 1